MFWDHQSSIDHCCLREMSKKYYHLWQGQEFCTLCWFWLILKFIVLDSNCSLIFASILVTTSFTYLGRLKLWGGQVMMWTLYRLGQVYFLIVWLSALSSLSSKAVTEYSAKSFSNTVAEYTVKSVFLYCAMVPGWEKTVKVDPCS